MTRTAKTAAEAFEIATELQLTFLGSDWTVRLEEPRFVGDLYYIIVE